MQEEISGFDLWCAHRTSVCRRRHSQSVVKKAAIEERANSLCGAGRGECIHSRGLPGRFQVDATSLRCPPDTLDVTGGDFAADRERRRFLTGGIASLGLAATGGAELFAGLPQVLRFRRRARGDHRLTSPFRSARMGCGGGRPPATATREYDVDAMEKSLADMDKGGVATAIVSITNPGLWFGDRAATSRLARAYNEFGARLVQDHPRRFGLFAAMPIPDVDATLKEIEYAYDTLKAYGVGLFTSYGDTWLGNPAYTPVMGGTQQAKGGGPRASDCCQLLQEPGLRAGHSAIQHGIRYRYDPRHYGRDIQRRARRASAMIPFYPLVARGRNNAISRRAGRRRRARPAGPRTSSLPNGFMYELKKFHYDVAGAANPGSHGIADEARDAVAGRLRGPISRQAAAVWKSPRATLEIQFGESTTCARSIARTR